MAKKLLVVVFIFSLALILSACGEKTTNKSSFINEAVEATTGIGAIKIKEKTDRDLAIVKAQELWRAKFIAGEDLSNGPCLSNEVIPDWVADIAHDPRQAVDDLPENQCSAHREGQAHHFVELDEQGNVIRTD